MHFIFFLASILGCSSGDGSGGASLQSISVSPINSLMHANTSQQFTAIGIYSDGTTQNITSQVSWNSSDPAALSIKSTGVAKAFTGTTYPITVTASLNGINGSTPVNLSAASLSSITVTTVDPLIHFNPLLHLNVSVQFVATGI